MPKIVRELSALEVKRLTHPGTHRGVARFPVGAVPGLMLSVTETGGRSWVLRTMVGGRRRAMGLGSYPRVSLADARRKAAEMLDQIAEGVDPVAEKKAAAAALAAARSRITFNDALDGYFAEKSKEITSDKHRRQWRTGVERLVGPELGSKFVDEITTQDVLRALRTHWTERTVTAKKVRQRVEQIMAWATVSGHRTGDNPAAWRGNLEQLLPKPSKVAKSTHWPALALSDAAPWFAALRRREGMAARALEILTLTAARSGEVRGATWAEIDLDAAIWTVPADRMKAGREHRVPLTPEAVALLKALPRFEGSEFVFPAPRGGALSDMSISAVMRRMQAAEVEAERPGWLDAASGRPAVPHGLRSSFRDWAAERGIERDVAELALAHDVGSEVERAYRRTDLFERRRAVMSSWTNFLMGRDTGAKVVPFAGGSL